MRDFDCPYYNMKCYEVIDLFGGCSHRTDNNGCDSIIKLFDSFDLQDGMNDV